MEAATVTCRGAADSEYYGRAQNRSYRESFDCIEQEIRNQRYFPPNPAPESEVVNTGQDQNSRISKSQMDSVQENQDAMGSRSSRGGNGKGGPAAVQVCQIS